jgi:lycopene beta-cyclase
MKPYDYIIAGAGVSGLTLAHLLLENTEDSSILLIDKDDKCHNDRTWCFWQSGDNLYEEIVSQRWNRVSIKGRTFDRTYDIAPYQYKMIRAIDFYQHLKSILHSSNRISWIKDDIKSINQEGLVLTESAHYQGHLVFNSTINYDRLNFEGANNILQHFKGWVIETEKEAFESQTASYMDFSVDQEGDCRFGYILPFSPNSALVEYTAFNKKLLNDREYNDRLEDYIGSLGITNYRVLEEEKGVIPMTDYSFQIKESDHLYHIGILGGFAKASTGYSFLRAQNILQKIVSNIREGHDIIHDLPYQKMRFKKYDATLLDVLNDSKYTGEDLFINLFKKNGAQAVFKFLDEETSLAEELKIMSSTPILDFGKSFVKQLMK